METTSTHDIALFVKVDNEETLKIMQQILYMLI